MSPANVPTGDALVEHLTPFAPRLETRWFTCERVDPVGKTVRYLVRLKDTARPGVGEIAWSHRHNGYTFRLSLSGPCELRAQSLHDLGEICQDLTHRQRRRTAARTR